VDLFVPLMNVFGRLIMNFLLLSALLCFATAEEKPAPKKDALGVHIASPDALLTMGPKRDVVLFRSGEGVASLKGDLNVLGDIKITVGGKLVSLVDFIKSQCKCSDDKKEPACDSLKSKKNVIPSANNMINSAFVTGDPPTAAFARGGPYWRHTSNNNWLGANLGRHVRIARAEVVYAAGFNANKLSVWYMDKSGKWVQAADMKRKQNGKASDVLTFKPATGQMFRVLFGDTGGDVRVDQLAFFGCG